MSYKFSRRSQSRLYTCHPKLQMILEEAIKHVDFTVLEGLRTKERQQELFDTGMSKTLNSKHLAAEYKESRSLKQVIGVSRAVDIAPYPIDWSNKERFILFQGFLKGIALGMGIKIRLGVDWDGDFNTKDHSFFDGPHIELCDSEE